MKLTGKRNVKKTIQNYNEEIERKLNQIQNASKKKSKFVLPKRNSMGSRYDLNLMYAYEYAVLWIENEGPKSKDEDEESKKYKINRMIKEAIDAKKISQPRKSYCPFSLSIMMLFDLLDPDANKADPKTYKKNDSNRSKYAKGMEYAYIHKIESHLVSAFVRSVGGEAVIKKKLKVGQTEHWLEDSVRKAQLKKLKKFMSK